MRFPDVKHEAVGILSFVVLSVLFASLLGSIWFGNLPSLLRDVSWLGIVATGQAMVIVSGEFDLSVGSVFAFVGLIFVLLLQLDVSGIVALLAAIAAGTAIGFVNGILVWKLRLPSLLVTLGFLFVYRGLVHFATSGFPASIPERARSDIVIGILGGKLLGYHNSIWICGLALVACTYVLAKTRFGNHLYAVGGDAKAAAACGVPVGRTKIATLMICAALAGLSGIVAACTLTSVSPTTADGLEFEAIAAAVIGGCSLRGGVGTAWGTLIGVGTLMALKAGLILLGINIFIYQILLGVVLVSLIAVKGMLPRLSAARWGWGS